MQAKTTFNTGLRIDGKYYSPSKWRDDHLVFLDGNTVTVFWNVKDVEPYKVYTVPHGAKVYLTDDEGEDFLGEV